MQIVVSEGREPCNFRLSSVTRTRAALDSLLPRVRLFAHRYAPKSDYSADPGAGPFVIAFGHLGSNAAIRESQTTAIGRRANTRPAGNGFGRDSYDNRLPDDARAERQQNHLDVPHEICMRYFPNGTGGRGTYTFIGGAADIVTVTPRTGTSGLTIVIVDE